MGGEWVLVGSGAHGLSEAIEAVVEPVVRAHGLTLVDVELRRGRGRAVVRIFIDKPGGVGINDCQRFSDEVGDLLDVAALFPESYDLEVSSPGLDRELRKDRELRWAEGKRVHVWVREPLDGRLEFVGQLTEVGAAILTLAEPMTRRAVPRALITKVRLEMGTAALREREGSR